MKFSPFTRIIPGIFFISAGILLASCTKKLSPEEIEARRKQVILNARNAAVSEYVASLPDEIKISQLFLVNIEGNEKYHSVEKSSSGNPLVPGGTLLFSYNISKDPLQTYEYIKSIRDFYIEHENVPPYIAVDQEGGDVNRLRGLTSVLWSQKKVADSFTAEGAEALYSAQARQMRNLGFHLNLAPVIEVENESNRDFLDTRTFGNLENTLLYGKIAVESYEKNGIGVVLKHFPGNSSVDPHIGLPKITYSESEVESYFSPFKNLLPLSSAVLMSHAIMKPSFGDNLEKYDMPACFSKYWVDDCIRGEFGFTGLVFSDDIFMGALAKNGYPPEVAVVKAIEAGVDVIMLSEKKFGSVADILLAKTKESASFSAEVNRAVENVIRYKIKAGILEFEELDDNDEIPSCKVTVKADYADFDLNAFNKDYTAGMDAYGMGK